MHAPAHMVGARIAEFHRYLGAECEHEVLIVEVRYSRGGHVSQPLLEKVARKRIARCDSRWGPPLSYPEEAPASLLVR